MPDTWGAAIIVCLFGVMERSVARARALVIGGSVGGLFAAHLLRSIGCEAAVFERAAGNLGDRGTGIGTREDLFAVMRRIGLPEDATRGVAVRGRIGLGLDGRILHELALPAVTSAWSRIWRPLRQALPDACYAGGKTLTAIEAAADSVTAVFADGSRMHGDLLVAADGLHSSVRTQLIPALKPSYAGYVAWRGVVGESQLPAALHDLMFRHMVFGFPDAELILSIPMPSPDQGPLAGERCCHFVWFRPVAEDALIDFYTDGSGHRRGLSIPPTLIRRELIVALKRDAQAVLAPQLRALVAASAQIILQPIFDLESPRIAFGRVALLGDAAFVARPHVASGVMKAAIDAETLANALLGGGGDIPAALARYDAERRPYGTWLVARGRHIACYFARDGERTERIERLMREYGSAGLVGQEPITARR